MLSTGKIRLEGLAFRAFHGVYPQERRDGNDFIVDIELETDISIAAQTDNITTTPDYTALYRLIAYEMEQPRNLLESLANSIAANILGYSKEIRSVTVSVSKLNPPIGGICQRAMVICRLEK